VNDISFDEVEKLNCEDRYDMFLSIVAEERDVWVLVNENMEFLKIHSEEYDIEYLPVWPHPDFSQYYSNSASEKLSPKCVSVPEFFAKWIPGLEGDGLKVGVFPNTGADIWIMEPSEVKNDLQEEFSKFGI